jgi:glycosyltransferase involved in cell wall biosynthesis
MAINGDYAMPLLSVIAGCFNEAENVQEFYDRVSRVITRDLPNYDYEIILIDNKSTDNTVALLKEIGRKDKHLKIIVNNRNFGPLRSTTHVFLQAKGDAVIAMASDLQDPPELIPDFVRKWEEGSKIVLAQKLNTQDSPFLLLARKWYYRTISTLSDVVLDRNVTGFGLYDRRVVEDIRRVDDAQPYIRGLICDLGYDRCLIPFAQPARKRGISKMNFYPLWDLAMLGITNHSKIPIRLATFAGLGISAFSFLLSAGYLIYKLLYWNSFQMGVAPLVIGMFFLGAVQLVFIGVLGEYIGSIHTQVVRRPLVIERERVNFD